MFTAGNILEDSFELTYFDQDQRQPPRVSVKWRQEQLNGRPRQPRLLPNYPRGDGSREHHPVPAPLEQLD